jgi:hypothetical protein
VTVPPAATSGQTINVSWLARNAGSAPAQGGWTDRVFLSQTPDLAGYPRFLGERVVTAALAAGAEVSRSLDVTLPIDIAGQWYLVVQTDAFGQVNEGLDEGNNITASAAVTVTQAPLPDLVVQGLDLTGNPTLRSGQPATVSWTTQNAGPGAAGNSFYERVRVVNLDTNEVLVQADLFRDAAAQGAIASGAGVARQYQFTLPDGERGTGNIRVTVTTDIYNQAYEGAAGSPAESNNAATVTRAAAMSDYADLVVQDLAVVPASPVSGDTLDISWTSRNIGDAPSGAYNERVEIINQTTGTVLADLNVPQNGSVAAGAGIARSASFRLPDGAAGVGQILVRVTTDRYGQVFERSGGASGEGNNIASTTLTATLATYPDLVISDISAPPNAAAGQSVLLTWTVTNTGNRAATGAWSERILLSDDSVIGNDTLIATQYYEGQFIAAGASVIRTATVTLPAFVEGPRRFVVQTDAGKAIFELDEQNNVGIDDAVVHVAPSVKVTLSRTLVSEAAGAAALTGRVTRSGDTSAPLTVSLVSDRGEVTLPGTVMIPAGQSSAAFQIGVIDNTQVDGLRQARITASAAGYAEGEALLGITDNDTPALNVSFPSATIGEGAGQVMATITRNTPTDAELSVTLESNMEWKATVAPSVTFGVGQSSIEVPVTLVDDSVIHGERDVLLRARAIGHAPGSARITVFDNDIPEITLALSQSAVSEGAGVTGTTLTITRNLNSSQPLELNLAHDRSELFMPSVVVIEGGQQSVDVPIVILDNDNVDGNRLALILVDVVDSMWRVPIPGETRQIAVQILDDDGPSLSVTLAQNVIG